jgi:ubiquinone/menaquinone biosynthesis C-methylase UbiE
MPYDRSGNRKATMDRHAHWEIVYRGKAMTALSWYRPHLEVSLELIERLAGSKQAAVLDIGGGASTLVDDLLAAGFDDVSVLDIAEGALAASEQRLGEAAKRVRWITADFLTAALEPERYDICHDRAVFHFLQTAEDKTAYFEQAALILHSQGALILATFALEGPERCSGLEVSRYDEAALRKVMGDCFEMIESRRESHHTPEGKVQEMMYFVLRRSTPSPASF